jgi:Zn-dependent protease
MAGFGWGKPVPVNPTHFQKPVRDETLIALAGPASNIIAAIIFGLVFRLFIEDLSRPLFQLMTILVFYNISLAIFNLIPIPPLDGSKILRLFLPYQTYLSLEQFSLPFLIFLVIAIRFNIPPINFLLFDSTKYFFQLFSGINIPL